jgi:hypothetical protein
MKKAFSLVVILMLCIQVYAQKFHAEIQAGTLWDKGYNNFMFQKNTYAYTRTYNHLDFGLLVSANLFKRVSLVSGYTFNRRYLEVNLFSNNPVNSFSGTKIYTNSIPLLLEYKYEPKIFPGKYMIIRGGGGIEFNTFEHQTFGFFNNEYVLSVTYRYGLLYTIYPPKNPVPFLQGYLGFGDHIGKNGNIGIGMGYKYLLSKYNYEMYYYFNNYISQPVVETFTISKKISELSINVSYSFGMNCIRKSKKG